MSSGNLSSNYPFFDIECWTVGHGHSSYYQQLNNSCRFDKVLIEIPLKTVMNTRTTWIPWPFRRRLFNCAPNQSITFLYLWSQSRGQKRRKNVYRIDIADWLNREFIESHYENLFMNIEMHDLAVFDSLILEIFHSLNFISHLSVDHAIVCTTTYIIIYIVTMKESHWITGRKKERQSPNNG